MSRVRDALERIGTLDRRIIFVIMALAIVLPLIFPMEMPLQVSRQVQDIYDAVEALPPGSRVLVASDFEPGSKPELYPFLIATYRHLFRKEGLRVVTSSLWVAGPPLVDAALQTTAVEEFGAEYGVDYVNLGFKEGRHMVILNMGENLRGTFPTDARGTPIDELPVMDGIRTLRDFDLIINVSSGVPGTREWVQLAQSRYDLRLAASVTSVMAPEMVPYYQARQLVGLAGGMAGAAEYETLLDRPGLASQGLAVLSFTHLLIVLAIVLANVSYFLGRGRRRRR
jgi:hypothetical protein